MNKRRISWLAAALVVPALVFGAMASSVAAEDGIDPKKAKDLIPIILVVDDSVLDGDGWTVIRDDFSSSPPPNTAACNNSVGKMRALEKGIESQLAAKGKLEAIQDPADGQAPIVVSTEIYVYNSAAPLAAAFKDLKTIYKGNDLAACLVSSIETDLSGATGKKVEPFLPGANDDPEGAAYAVEVTASQLIDPIRVENYSFTMGNTLVQMTFLAPKTMIDAEAVTFLLQLQAEAVELVSGY